MQADPAVLTAFLASCPPLDQLPDVTLVKLAEAVTEQAVTAGAALLQPGQQNQQVYLIRSGALDVKLDDGTWYGRFGAGDWVGYRSVLRGGRVELTVQAVEDSVLYALPATVFWELLDAFPAVRRYFAEHKPDRLRAALVAMRKGSATRVEQYARELMQLPLLLDSIAAARQPQQLHGLSRDLPLLLARLAAQHLPARDISEAISVVGQALARRLLQLAEQQLGGSPVPYAFLVAGSQARREQTAHSDQDNALLLDDSYVPAAHDGYFARLAAFVSDHLAQCGYPYCPGKVMATNPQWRQPLAVWQSYFRHWIQTPEPQALMYSSIFFDLACLHGDCNLLVHLQAEVLAQTQTQTLFQSYLAGNALNHRPPLGVFRGFVLEQGKQQAEAKGMDLKKRGVVPVIDMVRVYALAGGITATNTWERLEAVAQAGLLGSAAAEDLRDAFDFISTVRLQHQAKQIHSGIPPNNLVPPQELSALERRHLKDAFAVVADLQEHLARRYQADLFR